MPEIDEILKLQESDCPRCGIDKRYHDKTKGDRNMRCIRKKPYKLADGADVHVGMQIWHFHPYNEDLTIITGMVRFISPSGGSLTLWKYPEDRNKNNIFDLAHTGMIPAGFSCFSSLENAEKSRDKIIKEREKIANNR